MEVMAGVGELLVAAVMVGFSEGYICPACSSKNKVLGGEIHIYIYLEG
jgi:hypothetical protein